MDLTRIGVAKVNELTFFDKLTHPVNKTSSAVDISQLIITLQMISPWHFHKKVETGVIVNQKWNLNQQHDAKKANVTSR